MYHTCGMDRFVDTSGVRSRVSLRCTRKRGRANRTSPYFWRTGGSYLFFAAFFFAPLAFFAICNPPFRWIASFPPHARRTLPPGYAGPGVDDLASQANSRRVTCFGRAATQKKGCST